jgi:GT2 family glycosyltransferase
MIAKHPSIKLISTGKNLGSSGARNLGLASARGDYILFTDDDCIAKDNWVEAMCAALDDHPIVAGAIEISNSGYAKFCHNISHFHPFIPGRRTGPVDFLAGANMGFRRHVIDELGGFDDEMVLAGDMQLCLRARSKGYKPCLSQEAVVLHDPQDISLIGAVKSSFVHAASTIFLRNEYRSLLRTPSLFQYPLLIRVASPLIALKVTAGIYFKNPRLLVSFWTAPFVYFLKLTWCFGAASGLQKSKEGDEKSSIS